jgi:hypothetical protein
MRALRAAIVGLLLTVGCHHRYNARDAVPPLPTPAESRPVLTGGICEIDPGACSHVGPGVSQVDFVTDSAQAVSTVQFAGSRSSLFSFGSGSSPSTPTPQLPSAGNAQAPREMIEVEARFAIQVDDLARAADRFRALVQTGGGTLTYDTATFAHNASEATFEVRVPMAQYDTIVAAMAGLGAVRAREIKATDVSKAYHDEELLLANQEAALHRYEELLKTAAKVTEVLEVERQLERLRAEIDRLKGDLAWTRDKVARATIRVRLFPSEAAPEAVFAPEATFYPGLRAITLFDLRGESQRYGYAGGGISLAFKDALGIHFGRALQLELDFARSAFTSAPPGSNYAYLALLGSDFYSDLLGGGRRAFLNPYLGWRMGYTQSEGRGDFAAGGILGLDLLKTKPVMIDLHMRALALVGSSLGPHAILAPGLGINVAF